MDSKDPYGRQRIRPREGEGAPRKGGFKGTAENAKTQLCTRWKNGDCRFGARCNFAHGEQELRRLPARGRGRSGAPTAHIDPVTGATRGVPITGTPGRSIQPFEKTPYYDMHSTLGLHGQAVQTGLYSQPPPHASPSDSQHSTHIPGGMIAPGHSNIWAAWGYPLKGANGWVMYRVQGSGEPYYHNAERNITQWEQPPDFNIVQR